VGQAVATNQQSSPASEKPASAPAEARKPNRYYPVATETKLVQVPVAEPSSVALDPHTGGVWIVSDNGAIVLLDMRWQTVRQLSITGDTEGIAVHPGVERVIYVAREDTNQIHEINVKTGKTQRIIGVDFKAHPDFPYGVARNKGIEGVAAVPAGSGAYRLFAVIESEPARLIELSGDISSATVAAARDRLEADRRAVPQKVTMQIKVSHDLGVARLSDVGMEPGSRSLVLVSASLKLAIRCDFNGRILSETSVPGAKPEGICILPNGTTLIADDTGGLWMCPKPSGL
jgi:uncharacterized protein YjiK